jgi:class 3 adenylate cyclase
LLVAGGANFDFARGLPAQTEVTVAGVQWGGVITHSVGDQILALFGYPTNHEEDAERAVHAGLDLVARIGELLFLSGEPLQVRIAIATGLVFIGEDGTAIGEAIVVARHLRTITPPNSVNVSAITRKHASSGHAAPAALAKSPEKPRDYLDRIMRQSKELWSAIRSS